MHRWLLLTEVVGHPMLVHSSSISTVEKELGEHFEFCTVVKTYPQKGEYQIYYVKQSVEQIAAVLDAVNLHTEETDD